MVRLEVWGPYACFTRPELKSERMSYDVMTPSAARGILEAVYWHPGMKWHVDRIYVLAPVKWTTMLRNEVKDRVSARNMWSAAKGLQDKPYLSAEDSRTQRFSLLLQDVHYVIEAHFTMTDKAAPQDTEKKFFAKFCKHALQGRCWHTPYFGCREFAANFRLWPGGAIPALAESRDLGLMFYDFDYTDKANIQPMFFRAVLDSGVVQVAGKEVFR